MLAEVRRRGFSLVLLTNDSQETPSSWGKRLADIGLLCATDEIITAATIAAHVVGERYPKSKVLAVGDRALVDALHARDVYVIDDGSAEQADVVLVGMDSAFDQAKLQMVCRHIWAGAAFFATNADRRRPVEGGYVAGTGALVQAISFATEVEAVVTGKPSQTAAMFALERLGLSASDVILVGDAPISDISMGKSAGMTTVLTSSDGRTRTDPLSLPAEHRPDMALSNIREILPWLAQRPS